MKIINVRNKTKKRIINEFFVYSKNCEFFNNVKSKSMIEELIIIVKRGMIEIIDMHNMM